MAQPLVVEGAIQFDERLLARADSDFLTPRTRVSDFTRTQRSTLPALPCRASARLLPWMMSLPAPPDTVTLFRAGKVAAVMSDRLMLFAKFPAAVTVSFWTVAVATRAPPNPWPLIETWVGGQKLYAAPGSTAPVEAAPGPERGL